MNSPLLLSPIEKLPTGIPGFDAISHGGLPRGRTTLVSGTAGSAKTVFAAQFLAEGIIQRGEAAVFVTFEEPASDIRKNMASLGWEIGRWEVEGRWAFVDTSPQAGDEELVAGDYDLGALLVRIESAVHRVGATRVVLDSLGAIFHRFPADTTIRAELFRIVATLKQLGVTAVLTAERIAEYGEIARYGVEEFVADNVIILRNVHEEEKRRRTIEILKFRGTTHHKGEYTFTIIPSRGIVIIPLVTMELKQPSSNLRVTSGSVELDRMCGGGLFRDSIVLVSGATGTGKTLMATEFLAGGVKAGEQCLLFAFEESREQLFRNATGWGHDFEAMEQRGSLQVICEYPEVAGLENHLVMIQDTIASHRPNRVAIDSLSALERVATPKSFREFVIGITSFLKQAGITTLYTSTTPTLLGGSSVTEAHISTITDSIVLLRYVELYGEMRRGLTVLKMRGSRHDKEIREFAIDDQGMHIGRAFRNVVGILAGNPQHVPPDEIDRLSQMFTDVP